MKSSVGGVSLFTGKGDDGTTGLYYGGRVRKDAEAPEAYGTVDEAQAFLGLARAECERGSELDELLLGLERDLYVLMGELATAPENRPKLSPGASLVTAGMVAALEQRVDDIGARFAMPTGFVLPGQNRIAALLEVARTVVRRAERRSLAAAAEELDVGRDDLHDAALLALRVLERPVLEPPLDVEGVALLDVGRRRLGELVPADDAVELGLLLAVDDAVRRQSDRRDGLAAAGVAQLGVAGGVAEQDDLVDPSHIPRS